MQIITYTEPKLLIADEGKTIRAINDNGETLEDGTFIEPYRTNLVFLGSQITSLEQCEALYVEENIE